MSTLSEAKLFFIQQSEPNFNWKWQKWLSEPGEHSLQIFDFKIQIKGQFPNE
jgi:hypothetical protein